MQPIEIHQHQKFQHLLCLDLSNLLRTDPNPTLEIFNIVFEIMALVNNLDEINSNLHIIRSINNRKKTKVENSDCTRISVAE